MLGGSIPIARVFCCHALLLWAGKTHNMFLRLFSKKSVLFMQEIVFVPEIAPKNTIIYRCFVPVLELVVFGSSREKQLLAAAVRCCCRRIEE